MHRRKVIVALGVLTALMPFVGIPGGVKDVFYVVAGLWIAFVGGFGSPRRLVQILKRNGDESAYRDGRPGDHESETS